MKQELIEELVSTVSFLHQRGWAPATSSNYSIRDPESGKKFISQSGIDKGAFNGSHLLQIHPGGEPVEGEIRIPSAETLLHVMLYDNIEINCVLHTHSIYGTIVSKYFSMEKELTFSGYEIIKGISGVSSHDEMVRLPIFKNSQNMMELSEEIRKYFQTNPFHYGFLLSGHGLYACGKTISEARRHIEVYEFLMECIWREKSLH